jgi:hypothetical protein
VPTPIVFEDVAPVVPVRDLQAALERYRQLGFEVRAYGARYGIRLRSAGSRINSPDPDALSFSIRNSCWKRAHTAKPSAMRKPAALP